jgi:hypothetical protein
VLDLTTPTTDKIPPNPKKLIHALRSVGYSIEEAVADVVDNSISAGARHVLVRVERSEHSIDRISIVDDGSGMSDTRLAEAMRFGADTEQSENSLSKFGMGLKIASLSQGTELTVATKTKKATVSGRRWTVEGIKDDWRCDVLSTAEARSVTEADWGKVDLRRQGTVVSWSGLDRIAVKKGGLDSTLSNIMGRLRFHLGFFLHRFLEDKRILIWLDSQLSGAPRNDVRLPVDPLNPFAYTQTGAPGYPKNFCLDLPSIGDLHLEAYIWPPNSTSANYKLDGAAKRQGLYFYRNDRLIQGGGWNGFRDASEPHLSLARVMIDLPPAYDSHFSLDVQKSSISAPPSFEPSLKAAKDKAGTLFTEYLKVADGVYRRQERKDPTNFPLVPGTGISAPLHKTLRSVLAPTDGRVRPVSFEWSEIEGGEFFQIDREQRVIRLNRHYRKRLLGERRASATDVPLLKVLLFLLLHGEIDRGRVAKARREWLEQCNEALVAAMKEIRDDE